MSLAVFQDSPLSGSENGATERGDYGHLIHQLRFWSPIEKEGTFHVGLLSSKIGGSFNAVEKRL